MDIFLSENDWKQKAKVKKLVDQEVKWNPDFSGVEAHIKKGEFTYIDHSNELHGAILLGLINSVLED